jgi:hypothetical protein
MHNKPRGVFFPLGRKRTRLMEAEDVDYCGTVLNRLLLADVGFTREREREREKEREREGERERERESQV